MASMRIALLQLKTRGAHAERALQEGDRACRRAAALGADVALFPEMWQIGYAPAPHDSVRLAEWTALATDADGRFVGHFRQLARRLGMAIVVTYLQRWEGSPRNAATLIDRHGDAVLTYAKVHTCDFGLEDALTPGSDFPVAELDLAGGAVTIGIMICFDREFPESARALMLAGAEVIVVPNSCVLDGERIGQFRARAFENMVGVAMANYATPDRPRHGPGDANGHSVAFSGVCYDRHGVPLDHKLVEAGADEGIFVARFDLDPLRAYRAWEPWGDAYRKPRAYGALLGDAVDQVFARPRSRRRGGR
jgi:predicted amidohydrolase